MPQGQREVVTVFAMYIGLVTTRLLMVEESGTIEC